MPAPAESAGGCHLAEEKKAAEADDTVVPERIFEADGLFGADEKTRALLA